jgi:hypothetical protein
LLHASLSAPPGYEQSAMEFITGVSPNLRRFKDHGGKLIIWNSVKSGCRAAACYLSCPQDLRVGQ